MRRGLPHDLKMYFALDTSLVLIWLGRGLGSFNVAIIPWNCVLCKLNDV
jgi:hypothetical protein